MLRSDRPRQYGKRSQAKQNDTKSGERDRTAEPDNRSEENACDSTSETRSGHRSRQDGEGAQLFPVGKYAERDRANQVRSRLAGNKNAYHFRGCPKGQDSDEWNGYKRNLISKVHPVGGTRQAVNGGQRQTPTICPAP